MSIFRSRGRGDNWDRPQEIPPTYTGPATLRVSQDKQSQYQTVGAALEAAQSWRGPVVVLIGAGRYREALAVRIDVQLVADGSGPVVIDPPEGVALEVSGSAWVVGISLVGCTGEGVRVRSGSLRIDQAEIRAEGGKAAVSALAGTSAILRGCRVESSRVEF